MDIKPPLAIFSWIFNTLSFQLSLLDYSLTNGRFKIQWYFIDANGYAADDKITPPIKNTIFKTDSQTSNNLMESQRI